MKRIIFALLITTVISCSDDTPEILSVESALYSDLYAPQEGGQGEPVTGQFVKYNFETGQVADSETDWDIALRGTTILVNGGTETGITDEPVRTGQGAIYIADGTMASVTEVDVLRLQSDSSMGTAIPTGSDLGWYNYAGAPSFLITPLAGKIIVVRSHDGQHYAKMEILSYYKGAPDSPDITIDESRYYTFNYVYNPNSLQTEF